MIIEKNFSILIIAFIKLCTVSTKCSAYEGEEYVTINSQAKLCHLEQSQEKPKYIVITRESFEEGLPFFRSLGQKANK